ncbi:MAG TPA: hypothetical protein VGB78_12080 [Thermoplasmata archaeon]|jgi:hypothetical protein
MDPVMHLLLPLLLLLAIGVDMKMAILLAPLAIFPDFDALVGLHRAAFHSFVPMLVIPIMVIVYAKLSKPAWLLPALIAEFYLLSHLLMDLGGVAFLWPLTDDMYYIEPELMFTLQGGARFDFVLDYGVRPYEPMGITDFIAPVTFGIMMLIGLVLALFRKEAFAFLGKMKTTVKGIFSKA